MIIIWEGKSAARAVGVFIALQRANIDGPQIKKIPTSGSADFQVAVDTDGDEEMTKSAFNIARSVKD